MSAFERQMGLVKWYRTKCEYYEYSECTCMHHLESGLSLIGACNADIIPIPAF